MNCDAGSSLRPTRHCFERLLLAESSRWLTVNMHAAA